ncbi:transporter [Urechidicola croceus]|uniref:Transporter n=1 Tax=Urechidicola croceus TaxID=1850246 RepID=A0A1D8P8N0_9FLAO|nr:transporter [Urechidicola croceus]AOW20909.1 hypothetical protein LPB138_09595 [Urechidicola croceus]
MKRILLIVAFTFSTQLFSQIVTDRPDQTEASSTVPKGSFQIEMGLVSQDFDKATIKSFQGPSTLIRYGLSDNFELRLFNQYESNKAKYSGTDLKYSGLSDIEVGFKLQLLKKESVNTEIALMSHAILPTAKDALTNMKVGTINKLSISHVLSDKIGVGYNIGYDYVGEISSLTYSLALGVSLSDKFGCYIEPYGSLSEGGFFESNFDFGVTYLAKDNLQFDISYGTGLNNNMHYFSTGFSWNIPQFLKKK